MGGYRDELNQKAAEVGRKSYGLNIIEGDFLNLPKTGKYDVIIMRMVLEHMRSPSAVFRHLNEIIKPGGIIYITIPNFKGMEMKIFKKYCYALQVPCHLYHYTLDSLKKYLRRFNMKIAKIAYHSFDRDFVASAYYMFKSGENTWLYPLLSNSFVRKVILRITLKLLAELRLTTRMTVKVICNV